MSLLRASAVCLLLPVSAVAGQMSNEETCVVISDLASVIMTLRQQEVSMSELWSKTDGDEFIRKLILAAYEMPAFSTKANQERAVLEFSNRLELECYKNNWVMTE